MKKKVIGIISLVLAGTMMTISLNGCGTQVKATNQEVAMNGETIIVADEGTSEDAVVSTEDGITETEEETVDAIATDEDIVFYDEIGKYPDYLLNDVSYESMEERTVTAVDDIPVYSEEGIKVGYVKGGAAVILTEHGINTRWYRFENPVNGTDYDYLCMLDDDIPIDESELLASDEVTEWVVEGISNRNYAIPMFLDTPDSDMEYVEFSIDRQAEYPDATWIIDQVLFSHGFDVGDFTSGDYSTFCVECTENDMNIDCRIYYKDFVE